MNITDIITQKKIINKEYIIKKCLYKKNNNKFL